MKHILFLIFIICPCIIFAETFTSTWYNEDGTTYDTTTCTAGGDIILPTAPTKYGYTFVGWEIPYTIIEYIESTGTQYIDTGVVLNSKATVTTVGQFLGVSPGAPESIWGFLDSDAFPRWGCSIYSSQWLMGLNATNIAVAADTNKHTFVNETNGIDKYNSYIDGTSIYGQDYEIISPSTYSGNTLSAYIFARNHSGTAGYFSSSRIFSFNIVQDDVLVINLIPAKRDSDNVIGMYDLVSGQFFTNQGTGDFVAGPVVSE